MAGHLKGHGYLLIWKEYSGTWEQNFWRERAGSPVIKWVEADCTFILCLHSFWVLEGNVTNHLQTDLMDFIYRIYYVKNIILYSCMSFI